MRKEKGERRKGSKVREMKQGKLSAEELQDLVLDQLPALRNDILVRPMIGEDSAVIDYGEEVCVVSTDPITGAQEGIGALAVHISCNDIASNGAQPVGIQSSLLLPPSVDPQLIKAMMQEIAQTANSLGVEVIGGHTEVTDVVNRPLICVTAVGRASKDRYVTSSGASQGDAIIITKGAALEGTAILAKDFYHFLKERGLSEELLIRARDFFQEISVVREGLVAAEFGVTAMHDATEGGLLGGLYELSRASKKGFRIYQERIPVREETRALSHLLDFDPLTMISSGSMIITTREGLGLCRTLQREGIEATIIGEITEETCLVVGEDGEEREIEEAVNDALWRILKELGGKESEQ